MRPPGYSAASSVSAGNKPTRTAGIVPDPLADPERFLRFASVCFRQKRKTLRNNLAAAYPKEVVDALPDTGKRAEQLTLEELIGIYERLKGDPIASC